MPDKTISQTAADLYLAVKDALPGTPYGSRSSGTSWRIDWTNSNGIWSIEAVLTIGPEVKCSQLGQWQFRHTDPERIIRALGDMGGLDD